MEAAALSVGPAWFPWSRFASLEAVVHFARAVGGARSGQTAVAREELARLDAIHAAVEAKKNGCWAGQVDIQRRAAAAWLAHADGDRAKARVQYAKLATAAPKEARRPELVKGRAFLAASADL